MEIRRIKLPVTLNAASTKFQQNVSPIELIDTVEWATTQMCGRNNWGSISGVGLLAWLLGFDCWLFGYFLVQLIGQWILMWLGYWANYWPLWMFLLGHFFSLFVANVGRLLAPKCFGNTQPNQSTSKTKLFPPFCITTWTTHKIKKIE